MALQFSCNTLPATGAASMWDLASFLVASGGWTCPAGGDGLAAYSAVNGLAVVTRGGVGAGGMGNASAWLRLKMPGANREIVLQRGTTGAEYWKLKYCAQTQFTTGGAAATAPTGTNEQKCLNDASADQGTGVLMFPAGAPNRVSYWCDPSAPYGFGMVQWTAAGDIRTGLVLEAMQAGSYPAADVDPYIWAWLINAAVFGVNTFLGPSQAISDSRGLGAYWYKYGLAGATWATMSGCVYPYGGATNNHLIVQADLGVVNPYTGRDDETPVQWVRASSVSTPGWKGIGTYCRWPLTRRAILSTLSVSGAGAKDRLSLGTTNMTFPWGGVAPLL